MSHTIEWTASAHHDFNRTLKDVSSKKPNFSGELPFGLKLKDDGTLSGKPREVGIFSFKVKTDDGTGTPGEQDVVLKVNWNKKIDFISTMPLSSSGTSATSTTSNSDLQKYPFLISSACCNEAGGGRVPESMNLGSGLNRTIEMAFREVLGRVPSTRDPRSFVTALNQSFDIRQVEGHAEFTWNPRGYAGQTDLGGGVTGYQASLYKRATVMLDNALPLLDGLYTLNTNTDKEDSEAVRSIIRSTLRELVREIGIEGGPRRQRVDGFFSSLLNQGGQLDELRSLFALSPAKVNTLEEEANYSNYVALRDYVQSLRDGWNSFVNNTQATPDLGTSMVQLSRALSVAGEGVDEVYWALESVLISEAERRVIKIPGSQMKLDDYFTWASHFTKVEAPNLIYEAGKRGVRQIIATIPQLAGILNEVRSINTPDGLVHTRVQNVLANLNLDLVEVHNIAAKI